MVLEEPVEKNKLANVVTQQVKRWGFQRQKNSTENFVVIDIDSYADGPLGEKMRLRVGQIMMDIKERNRRQREQRLKDFAQKLAKVHNAGKERRLRDALNKLREGADEVEQETMRRRVAE